MNATRTIAAACHDLSIEVPGRELVRQLSFELPDQAWMAVLGKNGVGKTLTLETLSGLRSIEKGGVVIGGASLPSLTAKERARAVTLVTQSQDDAFENSVRENVSMGRYPHRSFWQQNDTSDTALIEASLNALQLDDLQARDVRSLSGGERQRTALAQALVQQTPLLLLDEPFSQLDPSHALSMLDLLEQHRNDGMTIIMSAHDVNIARSYASHILLLFGDGRWQFGPTESLLTEQALSDLYGVPMVEIVSQGVRYFVAKRTG
ncbi:MAG: ABC transporter ATP-binding protein [Woeseiaceae bacterium]